MNISLLSKEKLKLYVRYNFKNLTVNEFLRVRKLINIPASYIEKNDTLKRSSVVLEHMIYEDINSYIYFDKTAFNKNILKALEEKDFDFDENVYKKFPVFTLNQNLMCKIVRKYPKIIVDCSFISNELMNTALESGYIPKIKDFEKNSNIPVFDNVLNIVFKSNPKAIRYIYDLTDEIVDSARKRGFIAKEEDLINNPLLCKNKEIMTDALKLNPSLIIYISSSCVLEENVIIETLKRYKITEEDLLKNPNILLNENIMNHLPEYRLYSSNLSEEEKKEAIYNVLKNEHVITPKNLPFLQNSFGTKVKYSLIKNIATIFNYKIYDEYQNQYFRYLDKIIDNICNMRYVKNKDNFKYSNIADLNDDVLKAFKDINTIGDLISEIYLFTDKSIPLNEIKETLKGFYIDKNLTKESTTYFYNKVLNEHRNYFMKTEKRKIFEELKSKMKPSKKKINGILNGRKIKKIECLIKERKFNELNISLNDFMILIDNVIKDIKNNKDIKKSGIVITDSYLDNLAAIFMSKGFISEDDVHEIDDNEVRKFIIKKFEQIKFKFTKVITIEDTNITKDEIENIGSLNDTNYIIADQDRLYRNIADIIVSLNTDNSKEIDKINELKDLVPFVNLFDELDTKTFINILNFYGRIENKISLSQSKIVEKIGDIIYISNEYNKEDIYSKIILGEDIVNTVKDFNSIKYLDFYHKMFEKKTCSIPPINFKVDDISYTSGNYTDVDRLVIGIKTKPSCIDLLNIAGKKSYSELLLGRDNDIIMMKDQDGKYHGRIFLLRKGNIIQITTNCNESQSIKVCSLIAKEIMKNSFNDNIEHIFVNECGLDIENKYKLPNICDSRFAEDFIHADLTDKVFPLVTSNTSVDLECGIKGKYEKTRGKVSYNPKKEEIMRLKALNITMQTSFEEKEKLIKEFNNNDYIRIICGEDWYLEIKEDGTIKEMILPTGDYKSYNEIEEVKEYLNKDIKKYKKL